jgi:hypothetical protein
MRALLDDDHERAGVRRLFKREGGISIVEPKMVATRGLVSGAGSGQIGPKDLNEGVAPP